MQRTITLAALAATTITTLAGPLAPPAGPPSPTNKTLQQVEPRTPISGPTIITQPGSYYLTNNITTTLRGIEIQTAGVTLDLNGFTITGDAVGTTSDIGILVSASPDPRPIVIKNGFVRDFTGSGVNASSSAVLLDIDAVHVSLCNRGFDSSGPVRITNSSARECAAEGFRVGTFNSPTVASVIARCTSLRNGLDGFLTANAVITDSVANGNFRTGFDASGGSSLSNCVANLNSNTGYRISGGSLATNCSATGNTADGFFILNDGRVFHCSADGNGSAGFAGSSDTTIDSCTATDNNIGFVFGSGGLGIRNTAAGNTTNYDTTNSIYGTILTPAIGAFSSSNSFANISY